MANQTMSQASLTQLRDLHLPPAISIWPLAPGWYVLLCLLLGGILIGVFYRHQSKRYQRAALKQLAKLQVIWQQNRSNSDVIRELSHLMRRVALTHYPRAQVAALHGETWLAFLNETGKTTAFTTTVGRYLIHAPYQRKSDHDLTPLMTMIAEWIKQQS